MKRYRLIILVAIIAIMLAVCLCGCGNKMWIEFHNEFDYALIKVRDEYITVKIKQWQDYEGEQLLLRLENDRLLLVSSITTILYKENLPAN